VPQLNVLHGEGRKEWPCLPAKSSYHFSHFKWVVQTIKMCAYLLHV